MYTAWNVILTEQTRAKEIEIEPITITSFNFFFAHFLVSVKKRSAFKLFQCTVCTNVYEFFLSSTRHPTKRFSELPNSSWLSKQACLSFLFWCISLVAKPKKNTTNNGNNSNILNQHRNFEFEIGGNCLSFRLHFGPSVFDLLKLMSMICFCVVVCLGAHVYVCMAVTLFAPYFWGSRSLLTVHEMPEQELIPRHVWSNSMYALTHHDVNQPITKASTLRRFSYFQTGAQIY